MRVASLAGRRRLTLVAAVVVLALVAAAVVVAVLAGRDAGVRTENLTVDGVPEPGLGPVRLQARLYHVGDASGGPDGRQSPAVLLAHGYGGSLDSMDGEARRLAQAGYVVLTWTARGFGASGGLVHLNAPEYEVADARLLLDVLADRPEVLLDAPGDPRVGVAGPSYGGALALSLAGTDPRVDAIVPQITWNDLRRALFPQAVLPGTDRPPRTPATVPVVPTPDAGVFKKAWAAAFFGPGAAAPARGQGSPADPAGGLVADQVGDADGAALPAPALGACGRVAATLCAAYQQVAETGRADATMLDLLAVSSPASVVSRITAPTLLIQGQNDSLFPLAEADATASALADAGTEVSVVWSVGGHDGGPDETERWRTLTLDWFDRHLRGSGTSVSGPDRVRFQVTVPATAISTDDSDPAPTIRGADTEPGINTANSVALQQITVRGREQSIITPAGGWPAAVTTLPGLRSGRTDVDASVGSLATPPGQVAVFDSAPLGQSLSLAGSSSVRLRVKADGGEATLFVSLQDVAADGRAVLPSGLVSPVRLTGIPATGTEVDVALPAVVRDVPSGHRLRVVVAASDQAYALPAQSLRYRVSLVGAQDQGAVDVPTPALRVLDAGGLQRYLPWALALLAATAAVVGFGLWRTRRRQERPGGDGVAPSEPAAPLEVRGVAKVYRNGFRAVRDVSMRVEPGWVLGLLGPNGAGKTTLLRMVLGLIRPTAGRITLFGHEVLPGAPVLSRVGSFVEGPGFLPHATGWQNLELYWASTGRPKTDAHLEEALEVAGLGEDVHRTVRTYSHGMRQRLAIAQAMLGLPDLLVLDEPTNGLDPPQIREMREVLGRYAATGRTVVVSSHLLSEVEQTCSHVVVMHHGDVVATGAVAELVGAATGLLVDVDDAVRAAAVASRVSGARSIEIVNGAMTLELVGTPRSELVRALVEAGLAVDRVTPRRGLEQAFLALVGESDG